MMTGEFDVAEVADAHDVVHLPAEWSEWSTARRRSYMASSSTRRGLYLTLADMVDFYPREGASDLTKIELAAVAVALIEHPRTDPSDVRRFD